jgi:2-polyprenyl-3-methyl-5-hydroxy-6-metoxy-1,4-benzoquinol methylase
VKRLSDVAADFDAIASALADGTARETLTPAERALLAHAPAHAKRAIDVGCGDGVITRRLARPGMAVVGIDISPRMIDLARSRTDPALDIEYRLADVMTDDLPDGAFDLVVSVAMVHHLPLAAIVLRLAKLVAPGGTLLLQDVTNRRGVAQLPINLVAAATRRVRQLIAPTRINSRVIAAYHAHGAGEDYLDASMVRQAYAPLLPGARVYLHLAWRYSVVWQSPERPPDDSCGSKVQPQRLMTRETNQIA